MRKILFLISVDYLTIHAWPYNWSWIDKTDIAATTDSAIIKLINYIDKHLDFAAMIGKPLVLEEFGLPRDDFSFDMNHPTQSRDKQINK